MLNVDKKCKTKNITVSVNKYFYSELCSCFRLAPKFESVKNIDHLTSPF